LDENVFGRRWEALERLRQTLIEEIASNRRFLAGLTAAWFAAVITLLASSDAVGSKRILIRWCVLAAGIALGASGVMFWRREKFIEATYWSEDAMLRRDASPPKIQDFWQSDYEDTRQKMPKITEVNAWTILILGCLAASGILAIGGTW
jgi:hypothetical protein